ncbi:hypothetical protein ACWGJ9_09425 [Curtobacterium citreum]
MAGQTVPFETMGQPEFDRVVEGLLVTEFTGGGFTAQALDGRGGDGGIDVGVWDPQRNVVRIFQLKYFPEGFSGLHGRRRQQVKDSFDTAWKNHQPARWTLVLPRNPTREERDYVLRLAAGHDVKVDVLGRAELDGLFGKYPHLLDYFAKDRAVELLAAVHKPEEALAHRKDIGVVLDRVQKQLAAQSPHWMWEVGIDARGRQYQRLVARHPGAHLAEPLTTTMTATFAEDDEDLRRQFDEAMRFGVADTVVLPARIVPSVGFSGAPWFDGEEQVSEVHLVPSNAGAGAKVTLIAEDSNHRRLGSVNGKVRRFARGAEGSQLIADIDGGLTARWVIPDSADTPPQDVTFETSNGGVPARDVRRLTKFMSLIDEANLVTIRVNDQDFAAFRIGAGDRHAPDPAFIAFLDDLATIENELDVTFTYPPDGVSVADRLWAATLRQMLRGFAVPMPRVDGYNITLNGKYDDDLLKQLRGDGLSLLSVRKQFVATILGEEIVLDDVFIHQGRGLAENGVEHADALEAGNGKGRTVHIVGQGNQPWTIYQPARLRDEGAPVPVRGWEAVGLDEHPGLAKMLTSRAESGGDASAA